MRSLAIILIAAEPGPLPLALQSLLLSLPQVRQVTIASSEREIFVNLRYLEPAVVILLDDAQPRWRKLPHMIRKQYPGIRMVFLANNTADVEGVDLVLQQGSLPEELVSNVISLLI